jgi:voltage-gated potassium channel Kch
MACSWWLWKVISYNDDVEATNEFLDSQTWIGVESRADLSTLKGKIEAYIISVYLTTMTLTTVGYGDITADNTSERAGYVVFFVVGAFVWGNLLANVSEIHAAASSQEKEKLEKVQRTLDFLMDNSCPQHLRVEIIQVIRKCM